MAIHQKAIRAARFFGVDVLRIFSFRHKRDWPLKAPVGSEELDIIAAGLRIACDMAAEEDVHLGLENVR